MLYFVDQKQTQCGEINVNAVDRLFESALFLAVKFGYGKTIRLLNLLNYINVVLYCVIFTADIVQVLLENGASQRIFNKHRKRPKDLCESFYIANLLADDDPAMEFVVVDKKIEVKQIECNGH